MPRHSEVRILPFRPEQMFDLVADVQRYPEFLPWCLGSRIRKREGAMFVADLIIGFKMVREKFTSRVTTDREGMRVDVTYSDGPFKYLESHWIFIEHETGCEIDFHVDFEFRSRMLSTMIQPLFTEAVKRMVSAFEQRAHALNGTPDGVPIEDAG
jgi:coenzyme Q-binding protein COQ10